MENITWEAITQATYIRFTSNLKSSLSAWCFCHSNRNLFLLNKFHWNPCFFFLQAFQFVGLPLLPIVPIFILFSMLSSSLEVPSYCVYQWLSTAFEHYFFPPHNVILLFGKPRLWKSLLYFEYWPVNPLMLPTTQKPLPVMSDTAASWQVISSPVQPLSNTIATW